MAVVGLLFLVVPQTLLQLIKLPALPTGWARIIGLLALIIAACDIICGMNNVFVLIRASVYIRLLFVVAIGLLVLFQQMPFPVLLFGAADVAGVIWTATALRAEKST